MKTTGFSSLVAALFLVVSCSESDGSDPGGTGGSSASGGASGTGGTSATGGSAGASGTTATGGASGTGGSGVGGTAGSTGGTGGSTAGAAGSATGGTGGAVVEDECDTTAECVAIYGGEATDCVNSQSDESWCDCGGVPCKNLVDGGTAGAAGTGGTTGTGGTGTGGTGGGTTIPPGTFLADQDDRIVFEIESVAGTTPPSPWVFLSTGPCATPANCVPLGSGFYQYKGATPCNQSAAGSGVMDVRFQVKTAGRYRVVWRNLRDHRDGNCGDDRNNDSFMAFPTTQSEAKFKVPFKVYGGGDGTWNWSTTYDISEEKERVCLDFNAGIQEMEIHGRSQDHAIDKVVLFRVDGTLADCRAAGTTGFDALPETGKQP